MVHKKTFDVFNGILKAKIDELRCDYQKLKAADQLIGKSATEAKKHDLLNSIFALLDVQTKFIDVLSESPPTP